MSVAGDLKGLISRRLNAGNVWRVAPYEFGRVFHYTTARGLEGILRTKAVWATDIGFLNDTAEMKFGLDVAIGAIRERDELSPLHALLRPTFDEWLGRSGVFVACFSRTGDRLEHWRAYGDDATGYCVGLELGGMQTSVPGFDISLSGSAIGEVMYGEAAAKDLTGELVELFLEALRPAVAAYRSLDADRREASEEGTTIKRAIRVLYDAMAVVATFTKVESFEYEDEVRAAVIRGYDASGAGSSVTTPASLVKARPRTDGLFCPYVEMQFSYLPTEAEEVQHIREGRGIVTTEPALNLAEIILPPQTRDEGLARKGVEALLRQSGYDPDAVEIRASRHATYRS